MYNLIMDTHTFLRNRVDNVVILLYKIVYIFYKSLICNVYKMRITIIAILVVLNDFTKRVEIIFLCDFLLLQQLQLLCY